MSTVIPDPIAAPAPDPRRKRAEEILAPFKDVDPNTRSRVLDLVGNKAATWDDAYSTIFRSLQIDNNAKTALWNTWKNPLPSEVPPPALPKPPVVDMKEIPTRGLGPVASAAGTLAKKILPGKAPELPEPPGAPALTGPVNAPAPTETPVLNVNLSTMPAGPLNAPAPTEQSMAPILHLPPSPDATNRQYVAPNTPVSLTDIDKPQIVLPAPPVTTATKPLKVSGIHGNAVVFDDGTEAVQDQRNLSIYRAYGYPDLKDDDVAKLRHGAVPGGAQPSQLTETPEQLGKRLQAQETDASGRIIPPTLPHPPESRWSELGKQLYARTVGTAMGAVRDITLGRFDPETGTIHMPPMADESGINLPAMALQVLPGKEELLRRKGIEPDTAPLPTWVNRLDRTGQVSASLLAASVPWGTISRALAPVFGIEAAGVGSTFMQRLEHTLGTSFAVGVLEPSGDDETKTEAVAKTMAGAALFHLGAEAVVGAANAGVTAANFWKWAPFQQLKNDMAELLYRKYKAPDMDAADKMAAEIIQSEIDKAGGWEKVKRQAAKDSRAAVQEQLDKTPPRAPEGEQQPAVTAGTDQSPENVQPPVSGASAPNAPEPNLGVTPVTPPVSESDAMWDRNLSSLEKEMGKLPSTTDVQRKFKIGYGDARRLLDGYLARDIKPLAPAADVGPESVSPDTQVTPGPIEPEIVDELPKNLEVATEPASPGELPKPPVPPIATPKKTFTHAGKDVVGIYQEQAVLSDGTLVKQPPAYMKALKLYGYSDLTDEQWESLKPATTESTAPPAEPVSPDTQVATEPSEPKDLTPVAAPPAELPPVAGPSAGNIVQDGDRLTVKFEGSGPAKQEEAIAQAKEMLIQQGHNPDDFKVSGVTAAVITTRQGVRTNKVRVEFEKKPAATVKPKVQKPVAPPAAPAPKPITDVIKSIARGDAPVSMRELLPHFGSQEALDTAVKEAVAKGDIFLSKYDSGGAGGALNPAERAERGLVKIGDSWYVAAALTKPTEASIPEPVQGPPEKPEWDTGSIDYQTEDGKSKSIDIEIYGNGRIVYKSPQGELKGKWVVARGNGAITDGPFPDKKAAKAFVEANPVEKSAGSGPEELPKPPAAEQPKAELPPPPKTESGPPPGPEGEPNPNFGKKNKFFTEEEAKKARERLRDKFRNQFNVGFDPEMLADMFKLGAYYFEAGVRKFAAWAEQMIEDIGEGIRPYLKHQFEMISQWFKDNPEALGEEETSVTKAGERTEPGSAGGETGGGVRGQPPVKDSGGTGEGKPDKRPPEGVSGGEPAKPGTPRPDERKLIERQARERFTLVGKPPVELTPTQRREINAKARDIADSKNPGDPLTPEEQDILRQYTGNGGLGTADEGVLFEHYTSYKMVQWQWNKIQAMGYPLEGASFLEPAGAIGNYVGFAPAGVKSTIVEIDPIAAKIAKLLYPHADVQNKPFENFITRQKFDIVQSNVPFHASRGALRYEKDAEQYKDIETLHDFFFVKGLDLAKPNGLVVFLTSTGTMDKLEDAARRRINEAGEFLGAYRTPAGEFKKNTQYGGSVDAIFLRKRTPEEIQSIKAGVPVEHEPAAQEWLKATETDKFSKPDQPPARLNDYYLNHPEQMWGQPEAGYGVRQVTRIGVRPTAPIDDFMSKSIGDTIQWKPKETAPVLPEVEEQEQSVGKAPDGAKHGSLILDSKTKELNYASADGNLYQAFPKTLPDKTKTRVISAVKMMEQVDQLYDALRDNDIERADQIRPKLRQAIINYRTMFGSKAKLGDPPGYDSYLWRFIGGGTKDSPRSFEDPRRWMLAGLTDPEGNLSSIFTTNTIYKPPTQPRKVDVKDLADTAKFVYEETGTFDKNQISQLYDGEPVDTDRALVGKPGFSISALSADGRPTIDIDEEYLYGPIWPKIDQTESMMKMVEADPDKFDSTIMPALERQMDALTAALPVQATIENLPVDPFASYMDQATMINWLRGHRMNAELNYVPENNRYMWRVGGGGRLKMNAVLEKLKDGSTIRGDVEFDADAVQDFLNHKRVTKKVGTGNYDYDGREKMKTVFDVNGQAIQDQIADNFKEWFKDQGSKVEHLVPAYNRMYRSFRHRDSIGKETNIEGLAANFKGKPTDVNKHQWEAVNQMLHTLSGIVAHGVGGGKAQPLEANILTPSGWTHMGDIRLGDTVIAGDGTHTKVLGIFPQGEKEVFRVEFSDGSATECCDEHLWSTKNYYERSKSGEAKRLGKKWPCGESVVRPLSEIRKSLRGRLNAKNYSIPMVGQVRFNSQPIEIDPYLMGALLGDGGFSQDSVILSCYDPDILDRCRSVIPSGTHLKHIHKGDYRISRDAVGGPNPLSLALNRLELRFLKSVSKFIPDNYKFNDIAVRIAVLRGLMDTDGDVDRDGVSCHFSSTSERLINDLTFLVQSLGGIATQGKTRRTHYTHKGEKRTGQVSYRVTVTLPPDINPFYTERKSSLVRPKTKYVPARYIVSVQSVGRKLTQCILVDHPSHLYVTDDFIVTHNTMTAILMTKLGKQRGIFKKPVVIVPAKVIKNWGFEINQLFPNAVVLDTSNMNAKNRNKTLHRVAASDADFVLTTYEGMKEIPLRAAEDYLQEDLREYEDRLREIQDKKGKQDKRSESMLQDQIRKFTEKLAALQDMKKTNAIFFEDTGIDALMVDEGHNYKNAPVQYMDMSEWLHAAQHSDRAADMGYKTRYIHERRGGRKGQGVWMLTATPTPNNPIEIYSMMRYIAPDEWTERGIKNAGDFVENFGIVGQIEEPGTTGVPKVRTVFLGYKNLNDLRAIFRRYVDMRPTKAFNIKRPTAQYTDHVLDPTPEVIFEAARVAELQAWVDSDYMAAALNGWIPLSVLTLARKLAADLAIYNPIRYGDTLGRRGSKLYSIVEQVKAGEKGDNTQLIFVDLYRSTANVIVGSPEERLIKMFFDTGDVSKLKGIAIGDDMDELSVDGDIEDDDKKKAEPDYVPLTDEEIRAGKKPKMKTYELVNIHKSIAKALKESGIPEDQIAIINQGTNNSAEKKFKLQQANAEGKVRFLIGTTASMGEGMNLQANTTDIHHYDVPWTPAALEQREGRGVRQGNKQEMVRVHRYVGKGTSDAKMYAILARKAQWNEELWFGNEDQVMDFDQDHRNYSDISADAQIDESTLDYWTTSRSLTTTQGALEKAESDEGLIEAERMMRQVNEEIEERKAKVEEYSKQIRSGRGSDYVARLVEQHNEQISKLEVDLLKREETVNHIKKQIDEYKNILKEGRKKLKELIPQMKAKGMPVLPEHEELANEPNDEPPDPETPPAVKGPNDLPDVPAETSKIKRTAGTPQVPAEPGAKYVIPSFAGGKRPAPVAPKPPITVAGRTYNSTEISVTRSDGRETVSGWEIAPGLAVTESIEKRGKKVAPQYTVTHIPSGLSLGGYGSLEQTVATANRVAPLGDWTRSQEALTADRELMKAVQAKISGERGAVNFWKKKAPPAIQPQLIAVQNPQLRKELEIPNPVQNIWHELRGFPARVYQKMSPGFYNADIRMWPIFSERIRRAQEMPTDAASKAVKRISEVLKSMDPSEFEVFRSVVVLEDMYETKVRGDNIPFQDPNALVILDSEIQRLRSIATPRVLDSIDRHHTWMEEIFNDLVSRGKAEPNEGRVKYYPNMVKRFGESMDQLPGLPSRMRNPKRMYLKERKGHLDTHDADYIRVMEQYATRVYLHNMIDDFIEQASTEYDLTKNQNSLGRRNSELPLLQPQELTAMLATTGGSLKPDAVYTTPQGQKFKAFQFSPGRVFYPVRAIEDAVVADALMAGLDELNIDINDLRQKIGQPGIPQPPDLKTIMGEDLTYQAMAVGRQHALTLLPIEVANRLQRFRERTLLDPVSELARIATKALKMGFLHMNLFSWQSRNIFSNNFSLALESLTMLARQPEAIQLLRGKLSGAHYDRLLQMINDARVWDSSFVGTGSGITHGINSPELRQFRGQSGSGGLSGLVFDNPIGDFLRAYEQKLKFIEAIPKVANFLENYDRVMRGDPVKTTGVSLVGLDPHSELAVGRAARNQGVDYGATAPVMRFIQGTLLTFSPFYLKILPQVFRAMKAKSALFPGDKFLVMVVGLYVAAWMWNHLRYPEVEDGLDDYKKETLHLNTGFKDEDGKPWVWAMQTPVDIAAQWTGLHTLDANMDRVITGKMTAEQGARQQLDDIFGFQKDATFPTAPGALTEQLLNPMIQIWSGLKANRESLTGREIVPKGQGNNLWGDTSAMMPTNPDGRALQRQYVAKQLLVPYAQLLRADAMSPDSPFWEWISDTGPLAPRKLFGFSTSNPDAKSRNEWYKDREWKSSLHDSLKTRMRELYLEADQERKNDDDKGPDKDRDTAVSELNKQAVAKGFPFVTYAELDQMVQSKSYQIQAAKNRLRRTSDPARRREIESNIREMQNQTDYGNYTKTPKGTRATLPLPPSPQPPAMPPLP